jgi:putative flippase GtrA
MFRYCGTSIIALTLSQSGLSVAYGVFHASVTVSVTVALLVSIGPAYFLNRRYVWAAAATRAGRRRQLAGFILVGVLGSALTALLAAATDHLARHVVSDHLALTVVINVSALSTTVIVWLVRFLALDRYVFRPRPMEPAT